LTVFPSFARSSKATASVHIDLVDAGFAPTWNVVDRTNKVREVIIVEINELALRKREVPGPVAAISV